MNITFRYFQESDAPIIFGPWLKNQRRWGNNAYIRSSIYFKNETKKIQCILNKSKVILAVNSEQDEQVFGWVCYAVVSDILIVHYAFVKSEYRKMGIFKSILEHLCPRLGKEEIAITHTNPEGILLSVKFKLIYNPYLLDLF